MPAACRTSPNCLPLTAMQYWLSNIIDLLACTLLGSELATEITPAELKQPFCCCSVTTVTINVAMTAYSSAKMVISL